MGWQKASGYNRRALIGADISRRKRVIGNALRSRTDGWQATQVANATNVLNRMLDLGRPEWTRPALPELPVRLTASRSSVHATRSQARRTI